MNEYSHLINDYLSVNPNIRNCGFRVLSAENLNRALHNLTPFESPDMYAELEDMIVILEHFEFDASHTKKRSMSGKKAEMELEEKIQSSPTDNFFHVDKVEYKISLREWQNNFERCFMKHYGKIDAYKKRINAQVGGKDRRLLVGFLMEDQYPPYLRKNDKEIGAIPYVCTSQFVDVFNTCPDVDFVLYAYWAGEPEVIYLDHSTVEFAERKIDLTDSAVTLSKCNDNEVVMYGAFVED